MKINELTKFALMLGLLPVIPAYLLYLKGFSGIACILLSVFWVLSLCCFLSKKTAAALKTATDKIGQMLGKYIAIAVLAVVYVVSVIPTGLLMKLVKRDRLRLKKREVDSYWVDCDNDKSDYEFQF